MTATPDFFSLIKGNQKSGEEVETSEDLSIKTPDFVESIKNQSKEIIPDFYSAAKKQSKAIEKQDFFSVVKDLEKPKKLADYYRPEEKTPEEIKGMSFAEKRQYAKDLKLFQEFTQSSGLVKGALSDLTLSTSEYIPGLKPDEDDLLVRVGRVIGSALPIAKLANVIGKPLITLAAKSPVARKGVIALARMTGVGLGGATFEAGKTAIQGEFPDVKEFSRDAAAFAAIDAIMQGLGVSVGFTKAIRDIAKTDGVPVYDVLAKLWKSTKNFSKNKLKRPINKPGDISVEIVEDLVKAAKNAQEKGLSTIDAEFVGAKKSLVIEPELALAKKATEKPGLLPPTEIPIDKPTTKFTEPDVSVSLPSEDLKISSEDPKVSESLKKKKDELKAVVGITKSKAPDPKEPKVGTKQAKKRSEIIEIFRKAFNDPIRLGKIPKKFAGIHKGWPKVTRLLKDNDIETAAHEIGHNLHFTLYGADAINQEDMIKNVTKALAPFKDELEALAGYAPFDLEGFAEFTRLFVTNPEAAQTLAPKFYKKFEDDLSSQYPEMLKALKTGREYFETFLEGTPESRVDAQISHASDISKIENAVESIKNNLDPTQIKTQYLDMFYPAKKLVAEAFEIPVAQVESLKDPKNLYRTLRVLKGAVGKGDVYIMHETFDPLTLKKNGEGLKDILKELPEKSDEKEFNRYLVARRVLEKSAQGIETGIQYNDALVTVNKLKSKYDKLAKRLDQYNDKLLQYAEKSGLISIEQFESIKRKNLMYTPFQRVIKGKESQQISGKIQAAKPIKRMKGSTRDIIAPLESVIKNTYTIILNAEKNLAGKVLANLSTMKNVGQYVERVPTPVKVTNRLSKEEIIQQMSKNVSTELAEELYKLMPDFFVRFGPTTYPAGENIVTVFFEGKPKFFEVSPDIFEMWSKGMAPYTTTLLTKILRAPASSLRAGAILNPKFLEKNFIRDTWGSWLFTQYGKSVKNPVSFFIDTLYEPFAKMASAAKKDALYVDFMKAGGGMATMQSMDRLVIAKKISEIKKGIRFYQPIKILRKLGEISEEANRLNEFAKALEAEGETRLGREIAAFAARDLSIDFAKMGLQTKALNQMIPFFNATIQGGDKLIRTIADPGKRADFLARAVGFVLIPSLIFSYLNQDDEEIDELQEQEKDFNFITRVGDSLIKIPVPFEVGVITHGLARRMYKYFMSKDPKAFEGFMGSILDAALPSFIPAFGKPLIEVYANKNFFTGGRIVPLPLEKLSSKLQFKTYTSTTARTIGRAVNYMIGEDTQSKFASPAIIDHFIFSWTGGLGRLVVNMLDLGLNAAGVGDNVPKPTQHISERLGLNAFSVRFPRASTKSIEKFYNNFNDAQSRIKSLTFAEKNKLISSEDSQKSRKKISELYDVATLNSAYKAMQNSQRAINEIMKHPDITSDEKREMIDKLYLQQIEFAKRANQSIYKNIK